MREDFTMDLEAESREFFKWTTVSNLPSRAIGAWYALSFMFYEAGWPEWLAVDTSELARKTSLSEKVAIRSLEQLVDAGRLSKKKQSKNDLGKPTQYKLVSFFPLPNRTQEMDYAYLAELRAFHKWVQFNYLPSLSQLLWYRLAALFDEYLWPEWLPISNTLLRCFLPGADSTAINARNNLVSAGLLKYRAGGTKSSNLYQLVSLAEKHADRTK